MRGTSVRIDKYRAGAGAPRQRPLSPTTSRHRVAYSCPAPLCAPHLYYFAPFFTSREVLCPQPANPPSRRASGRPLPARYGGREPGPALRAAWPPGLRTAPAAPGHGAGQGGPAHGAARRWKPWPPWRRALRAAWSSPPHLHRPPIPGSGSWWAITPSPARLPRRSRSARRSRGAGLGGATRSGCCCPAAPPACSAHRGGHHAGGAHRDLRPAARLRARHHRDEPDPEALLALGRRPLARALAPPRSGSTSSPTSSATTSPPSAPGPASPDPTAGEIARPLELARLWDRFPDAGPAAAHGRASGTKCRKRRSPDDRTVRAGDARAGSE